MSKYYLEDWAKANLSPESQEKFFTECDKIKRDSELLDKWLGPPEKAMDLTQEQINFVQKHNIYISMAYMGMVRISIDNNVIFQTSAMSAIGDALANTIDENQDLINYDSLKKQTHKYLNYLMSAPPELQSKLFSVNMPLFADGELTIP